jgi:hypothetical protein
MGEKRFHITPFSGIAQVFERSLRFRNAVKTRIRLTASISLSCFKLTNIGVIAEP